MKSRSLLMLVVASAISVAAVATRFTGQSTTRSSNDAFRHESVVVRRTAWQQLLGSQPETQGGKLIPELAHGLKDVDAEVREYVVYNAYRFFAATSASSAKLDALSMDSSFQDDLLKEAASGSSGSVRGQALATAVIIFGLVPEVEDSLIARYKAESDVEARRAILHALSYAAKQDKLSDRSLEILVDALGADSGLLRGQAARVLLQLPELPAGAEAGLGNVIDDINSAVLLGKAANTIAAMDHPPQAALPAFAALLDTADVFLLRSLIPAIANYGSAAKAHAPSLSRAIERFDEPERSHFREKYLTRIEGKS